MANKITKQGATGEDRRRPVCITAECGALATHAFCWPGRPALACCGPCGLRAQRVGAAIGISIEVFELTETICAIPFGDDRALEN